MFEFSLTIVWIVFFFIHLMMNAYLYFLNKKIVIRFFILALLVVISSCTIIFGWQYGLACCVAIISVLIEKLIFKNIIVINKLFATAVMFWFVFGSFELFKALAMLFMVDYSIEFATVFIHKRVFPRRLDRDNDKKS